MMGRDRTLGKGLSRAAEVSEQFWLSNPWVAEPPVHLPWFRGWQQVLWDGFLRDPGNSTRGKGKGKAYVLNENQCTAGKGFWQYSTMAGAIRLRSVIRVRYRSGNDWCAPEKRNTYFWMTQPVILLPGAVLLQFVFMQRICMQGWS